MEKKSTTQTTQSSIPPMPSARDILNVPTRGPIPDDVNPYPPSLRCLQAEAQLFEFLDEEKNQKGVYIECLNSLVSFPADADFLNANHANEEKPGIEKIAYSFVSFQIQNEVNGRDRTVKKVPLRNDTGPIYVSADDFFRNTRVSHEGNSLSLEAERCRMSSIMMGPGSRVF